MGADQDLVGYWLSRRKTRYCETSESASVDEQEMQRRGGDGPEPPLLASMAPFNNFSHHVSHPRSCE